MKVHTVLMVSLIAFTLLFAGCGTSPKTQLYVLNTIDKNASVKAIDADNIVIKMGPVSLPGSLDKEPIVTRMGSNRLFADEFNRWSGDYQNDIERILGENISILLPASEINLSRETILSPVDFQVFINVREFDGTLGGIVILNTNWTVVRKGKKKTVVSKKSIFQEKTGGPAYEDYVAAQSRLLAKLSQEIADEIGGQLKK